LGMVSMVGIPGQILLGALSDRIGREWVWTAGCSGFAICYLALIGLEHSPSRALLYAMVISQGFLGYALTSKQWARLNIEASPVGPAVEQNGMELFERTKPRS